MSETPKPIAQKEAKTRPVAYLAFLPGLVRIARDHGYALAVHGSMVNDFDVIAVPWIEEAAEPLVLAEAIRVACGGVFGGRPDSLEHYTPKPHGRMAVSIHLCAEDLYVDLSIMHLGAAHL